MTKPVRRSRTTTLLTIGVLLLFALLPRRSKTTPLPSERATVPTPRKPSRTRFVYGLIVVLAGIAAIAPWLDTPASSRIERGDRTEVPPSFALALDTTAPFDGIEVWSALSGPRIEIDPTDNSGSFFVPFLATKDGASGRFYLILPAGSRPTARVRDGVTVITTQEVVHMDERSLGADIVEVTLKGDAGSDPLFVQVDFDAANLLRPVQRLFGKTFVDVNYSPRGPFPLGPHRMPLDDGPVADDLRPAVSIIVPDRFLVDAPDAQRSLTAVTWELSRDDSASLEAVLSDSAWVNGVDLLRALAFTALGVVLGVLAPAWADKGRGLRPS
jgi:hypothetical protein